MAASNIVDAAQQDTKKQNNSFIFVSVDFFCFLTQIIIIIQAAPMQVKTDS